MRDLPEGSGQVHDTSESRAEVEGPRGVEVVVRRHPEILTEAEIEGQVGSRLPVVLEIDGVSPLAGMREGHALRGDDAGGNAEHEVRAVVAGFGAS